MEVITSKVKDLLKTNPQESEMTDFLNSFQPDIKPKLRFDELDRSSVSQLTPVYVHLMVQDISETFFYYSAIMKRPLSADSDLHLYKFGLSSKQQADQLLDDHTYMKVMTDREAINCMPIRYQSPWMQKLASQTNKMESVKVVVDGKMNFQLGQTFQAVCVWEPEREMLYYVRSVTPEESTAHQLNLLTNYLAKESPELNFLEARSQLKKYLAQFCSERYSEFLICSLVSTFNTFISCEANMIPIISELMPRVLNLKIKAPFSNSLFPYKNEEGELILTPMQMSNQPTYIILDFSELSQEKEVKIKQAEIDNLKALKVFVEEGQTVYRWEIGESMVKHPHSGMVVKASNIISPSYHLKNQLVTIKEEDISLNEQTKYLLRKYLQEVRKLDPKIGEESKKEIEVFLLSKEDKTQVTAESLKSKIELAKLLSISKGKSEISIEECKQACKLLE